MSQSDYPILGAKARKRFEHPLLTSKPRNSDTECSNHHIVFGYFLSVADTLKEVISKTYFRLDFQLPSDKTVTCRFGKTLLYGIIQAWCKILPERLTIGFILPHVRFAMSIMGKRAGIIVFAASI